MWLDRFLPWALPMATNILPSASAEQALQGKTQRNSNPHTIIIITLNLLAVTIYPTLNERP